MQHTSACNSEHAQTRTKNSSCVVEQSSRSQTKLTLKFEEVL